MKNTTVLFALIIIITTIQSASAIGIGLSPTEITIDDAIKDAVAERSLTIYNTGSETTTYSLSASGEIGEWVSFYEVSNLETSVTSVTVPGQDRVSVLIRFQVPEDAPNAEHTGSLDVNSVPTNATNEGAGQDLSLGASSKVSITVIGTQLMDGVVNAVLVEDVETGYPLVIKVLFRNSGNVVAKPKIDVNIIQDEFVIDSFIHQSTKVKPTMLDSITTEWNTTAANLPGEYVANVAVSLGNQTLHLVDLPFEILPEGTITRQGNLASLSIEGEPVIGTVVKVNTYFENTGRIKTVAKFTGEVYKDGVLIDTLSSDELTVEKGDETVLISYLKLESTGDYLIKGKVIYSGKETQISELAFKVADEQNDVEDTPGFAGSFAAICVLAIFMLKKKIILSGR